MSLAVRRVSLIDDRPAMLELLKKNFGPGQEERFEWCHTSNPAGESWTWFVYEREKSIPVAMATVFPRQMHVNGKLRLCGQVGEFAVQATHRSLGPAVLLQRTTFEPVNSGSLAMVYDCPPHDQGMSTFVRLGRSADCETIRYALLLSSDKYLGRRLGNGIWTRPIIIAANHALRVRRPNRSATGIEITEFGGRFGEEFSTLDDRVSSVGAIRASRSAELLNWRHREKPASNSNVLVARRSGEIRGFLVFWVQDGNAYIWDLFGLQLPSVGAALLEAAIDVCKRQKLSAVYGVCSPASGLSSLFERAGFRPRERDARIVAYENSSQDGKLLHPNLCWDFTEVEIML
jgi:hypothetical protein